MAAVHPPRRFRTPLSRTSPSPASPPRGIAFNNITIDQSPASPPTSTPPSQNPHPSWQNTRPSTTETLPDGQDHDRMDSDNDSRGSASEDEMGVPQSTAQMSVENDENGLHGQDAPAGSALDNSHSTSSHQTPLTSVENPSSDPPAINNEAPSMMDLSDESSEAPTSSPTRDWPQPGPDETVNNEAPAMMELSDQSREEGNELIEPEQHPGREEDSGQEESADEEERPYWADFVEDTSQPSERELQMIEQEGGEIDARDHSHWEAMTYETLEDPEYVPLESGRIIWTVKPINGTPENPNREKILRSPTILVGGFYWNIKYFPRGNEGTEHMSVYLECSPKTPHALKAEDDPGPSSADQRSAPAISSPVGESIAAAAQGVSQTNDGAFESPSQAQNAEGANTEASTASGNSQWEVAAQMGCIVYNPNEPRVNAFRKCSHRFNSDDADWGWTRFHGPWETIHRRQRNERQALLRNDTLVFCAYIRTVRDDTKNLWYHAPKHRPSWESYKRIGVKSLASASSKDSNLVAAVSCWLHIKPVVNLIMNMEIPSPLNEPMKRRRPLFQALQQLVEYTFGQPHDTSRNAVNNFISWMDWYVTETDPPRDDVPEVVTAWEWLRWLMNFEASGDGDIVAAPDCFQGMLLLKQPDPWAFVSPIETLDAAAFPRPTEPRSVQETIDLAISSNQFRSWETFAGNPPGSNDIPQVLKIELHRQRYNAKARRWDKLTHRIELNENVTYASPKTHDYTLFGMIVHSGALESRDFYSVVRPQGPGTPWIRYCGSHSRRDASYLTTTQAITAHEGKGDDSTGNTSVAYIALYVRTDIISDILFLPSSPCSISPLGSSQLTPSSDPSPESLVSVRVFRSSLFDSHQGRGLPDLWASDTQEFATNVLDMQFPKSTTMVEAVKQIHSTIFPRGDPTEANNSSTRCRWWYLNSSLGTSRGMPRLVSILEETVEQAALAHDGVRLWLHRYEVEPGNNQLDHEMAESEPPGQAPSGGDVDGSGDADMTQDEPAEHFSQTGGSETSAPDNDSAVTERGEAQQPEDDAPAVITQQPNGSGPDFEDAIMNDDQDPATTAHPPLSILAAPFTSTIYIFVKFFDSHAQTLKAIGDRVVPRESNVYDEVTRIVTNEGPLRIWSEKTRSISDNDLTQSMGTFDDNGFRNGSIFIAQRQLTARDFFEYLRHEDDPGYAQPHRVNSVFGTEYQSLPTLRGLVLGQGTRITMAGDAYVGGWVDNRKSGYGTMAYASGDTYTGEWAADERDGHGTMVYGGTKNVYEGGWRKGRRHGKGVMRYEVADEEMALCKICYENEMDALLYDCGHVVACEECARQVDCCPVCRKGVRGVCRIWRT
ncbi:MAG: hypothetical protein Q9219_002365 [cf. Caloplaca sp. 3 TL-2023]